MWICAKVNLILVTPHWKLSFQSCQESVYSKDKDSLVWPVGRRRYSMGHPQGLFPVRHGNETGHQILSALRSNTGILGERDPSDGTALTKSLLQ